MRHGFGLVLALVLAGCGTAASPGVTFSDALTTASAYDAPASTQNFAKVNDGLYRGGLPQEADLKDLVKLGVKTDVSLLGAAPGDSALNAREKQLAEGLGMKWVNYPVPFTHDPDATFVKTFLALLDSKADQPVYVHCLHGRDRTGTMIALYRIRHDGYTPQRALTEMESFGFNPKAYPRFATFVLGFSTPVAP